MFQILRIYGWSRALDLLLTYRPNKEQFPIIVTQVKIYIISDLLPVCEICENHHCQFVFRYWNSFQDCGHKDTQAVIESYGDQIIFIQQPGWSKPKATNCKVTIPFVDLSEPVIPPKEKKFKGYFKIARHYGWALNKTFVDMAFDQVCCILLQLNISWVKIKYLNVRWLSLRMIWRFRQTSLSISLQLCPSWNRTNLCGETLDHHHHMIFRVKSNWCRNHKIANNNQYIIILIFMYVIVWNNITLIEDNDRL